MQSHRTLAPRAATLIAATALLCASFMPVQAARPSPPQLAAVATLELLKSPAVLKERVHGDLAAAARAASNTLTRAARSAGARSGREVQYDLSIEYADGTIYNPATGKNDKVRLRAYNGAFVAPVVVMKPGQTARFNLSNKLPAQGSNCSTSDPNTPAPNGCFNVTNLHTHGLWVSPTGNSDNVLLSLNPGVSFEYEYNVPSDHPAGTFWYHPHKHGSTAMQVASGMAGALVVKGNRYPDKHGNGDLDTLLAGFEPAGGPRAEVMLLQQIPYACFTDAAQTQVASAADGTWTCGDGQVGVVENFQVQVGNFKAWAASGRYTLINGQARPQIAMQSARLYRWRLIDAAFAETVALRIRKLGDAGKLLHRPAGGKSMADEAGAACNGADVIQFEVASDGLTHDKAIRKLTNTLQPGYRSDVLFVLPESGLYCVYDDSTPDSASISAAPENAKVLAIIDARGGARVKDQAAFVTAALLKAARRQPAAVRDQVTADLRDGLKLSKFVPHPTITQAEIDVSKQEPVSIQFDLVAATATQPIQFLVNGQAYQAGVINHTLILGTAQTWKLSSRNVSHPFHIHVNPFQIVAIRKLDGTPKDPQYKDLEGTWRDTLLVIPGYDIEVRSRYERYIGEFVLHCHILDHEDQGMMQNVQVVLPDGRGKAQRPGHH